MDYHSRVGSTDESFSSAIVAPLVIRKERDPSTTRSNGSRHATNSSDLSRRTPSLRSQSQLSPPLTPRTSRDNLHQMQGSSVFHNYIRAFYHFHPTSTVSSCSDESSITVSINQGDVILVHSIHPNGWADGTLIADGSRGWLPTNYCEVYDPQQMMKLLNSLTHLWDLVRIGENGDLTAFAKQDYVRGTIGGVRSLLEQSQCLTRDDALVQAHAGIRRLRKGLLGDLSTLVKTAKQLQTLLLNGVADNSIYDLLDDLVFKALKLVARAVRFLDLWQHDAACCVELPRDTLLQRPLTPPKEIFPARPDMATTSTSTASIHSDAPSTVDALVETNQYEVPRDEAAATPIALPTRSSSTAFSPAGVAKRCSASHRVSYTSKGPSARQQNLASVRLDVARDSFLGFIGSHIGLHLQSRSSAELYQTTRQSVLACEQILCVVEAVVERDQRRTQSLCTAKDVLHTRLVELVKATKQLFSPSEEDNGEPVFMADQGQHLVSAATNCVRAVGECVNTSKVVIDRIGDFESQDSAIGLADAILVDLDVASLATRRPSYDAGDDAGLSPSEKPLPAPPSHVAKHIPEPLEMNATKPLPEAPFLSPATVNNIRVEIVESPMAMSFRTSMSESIAPEPTLAQLPVPELPQPEAVSPTDSAISQSPITPHRVFGKTFRTTSANASFTDSNSTYPSSNRGDSASIISHTSTRATTPDTTAPRTSEPRPMMSFESFSESTASQDDCANVEAKLLETTYVHELVYNKEGQIAGGSLKALIEQLTLHDSTPDPVFVSTFYLTFRLFTTPSEFAECLIHRFDYIGDSTDVGLPVRLRVFNVFKGWLESHWQSEGDESALILIITFAMGRLQTCLPAAGKRLAELAAKVSESHTTRPGQQIVSSHGKTVTSSIYSGSDKDTPSPIVSKSQLNALKNARNGGTCSILDFDPLELARQITIIESRTFCAIHPEELLSSRWTKKNGEKAPNVRAMSTLSTDLANLVTRSILYVDNIKSRALVVKHWIKIAKKCLDLNNYDSLMAIICSVNCSYILRLHKLWDLVSQKNKSRLEEMVKIVEVGRNYAALRQRLVDQTAPCIPFVGIYLTDLTFVDVGNQEMRKLPADRTSGSFSVINFDKHMRTAKIIGQLQRFQVPYNLTVVPELQDWLDSQIQQVRSEPLDTQSFYRQSLMLEPRQPAIPKFTPQESSSSTTSPTDAEKKFNFMGAFSFTTSSAVSKEKAL